MNSIIDSNTPFFFEWAEILRATFSPNLDNQNEHGNAVRANTDLIIHPMNDPKIVELQYHILCAVYQINPSSFMMASCIMYTTVLLQRALAKNKSMLTSSNIQDNDSSNSQYEDGGPEAARPCATL
ncbi:MAG TPA: hypothetical protein VHD33_02745 [Legionellaceae bacterium]|nr:hypothetical protein [Legionellaceae bacterium]